MTNQKMDEHLHRAVIEDVQFLMDSGLSFDLACLRIGRKPDTVEKLFTRHGHTNPSIKMKESA